MDIDESEVAILVSGPHDRTTKVVINYVRPLFWSLLCSLVLNTPAPLQHYYFLTNHTTITTHDISHLHFKLHAF